MGGDQRIGFGATGGIVGMLRPMRRGAVTVAVVAAAIVAVVSVAESRHAG